ncbi:MAG: PSD1 and planctomycete cytochrome C domain-containing protein [Planctomycetaceae bacterium]
MARPRGSSGRIALKIVAFAGAMPTLVASPPTGGSDPAAATTAALAEVADTFERRVRPLLAERCIGCHGPDTAFASLRLDSREGLLAGGDGGPVVFPGTDRPGELSRRVRHADETTRMPPPEAGNRLAPDDIAAIEAWLAAGAPWPAAAPRPTSAATDHWAFRPRARHAIGPIDALPSPIDRFIDRRLAAAGLVRGGEADRRTLLRRASYALIGLPPTADEVTAFEADRRPDAWARQIDRLLSSPRFGEHLGRMWLDVARYADTKGYVYDREERFFVHAPAYREWVIDAFDADLPFDRFVSLQLAADRLVPPDGGDLAALGFLTTGRRFLGVTPDIIDDRIDVVTRGLLGLTVSCARCHDHKYDPVPTADYYALYGVFASSVDRLVPLPVTDERPAPPPPWAAELARRRAALADGSARLRGEAATRARQRVADYLFAQRHLDRYPELGFDQIIASGDLVPAVVRRWQVFLGRPEMATDPVWGMLVALLPLADDRFAAEAPGVIAAVGASSPPNPLVAAAFATPPHDGRDLVERYGRLFAAVEARHAAAVAAAQRAGQPPPAGLDDPAAEALRAALVAPTAPCAVPDEPIAAIENLLPSDSVNELWKLSNEIDRWLLAAPGMQRHALAVFDRPVPTDAPLLRRGNPALKGPPVPRRSPTLLAGAEAAPFRDGSGRLELAAAIIDADNPLTARVWANRLWTHLFGTGLVDTPSDFGTRAAEPSHPELLDWLAEALVHDGWSTKRLLRRMLLSETFRQASTAEGHGVAAALDPAARLLWRMRPRRLTVEQFRDTWLALSGELAHGDDQGRLVEPFATAGPYPRTVRCLVDRQYLAAPLRLFDMANPDLHSPARPETTVPQQALFALNHPFVAARARALAARVFCTDGPPQEALDAVWRLVLQRPPSVEERRAADGFLEAARRAGWHEGQLSPAEQLVQALLVSNEVMFIE